MHKYKLFLKDTESGRLGRGGEYSYDGDGLLELQWYGETSYHAIAPGGWLVQLDDEQRDVRRLQVPKARAGRVMWLCGIPAAARCKTLAEYDEMAAGYLTGPVEHIGGPRWQVARARGDQGREYIVAAWVDMRIGRQEADRMMEQLGSIAPEWFVDKLLRRW